MRPSNNLKNKILLDTYWRVHLEFIYETSGSRLFTTTTGTQSGAGVFGKSRLVMTFLTNLEVTEILCDFRLVLEERTGQEITESYIVLRPVFSKRVCFIR